MSQRYLFICSLGPVQGFIAAARSSRDLAYGSWLLSELAKTAARVIADKEGLQALVFPAPESSEALSSHSELSVANKVVAVVSGDIESLAGDIRQAVKKYLLREWEQIEAKFGSDVDRELARKQIQDLPEFYWAAAPLPSEDTYRRARALCEEALAARKATRDFSPFKGRSRKSRFKSSIDGVREHVLTRIPDYASNPNREQMEHYRLRNGELLSGVDLLKRWGELPQKVRYQSTSHMAALPFMEGLGDTKAEELYRDLVELFKQHGPKNLMDHVDDYSVLYPSEVRAALSRKDRDRIRRVLREQEEILTRYAGTKRPGIYYALLVADGDHMGKVIDAQQTPEDHRKLSRALSEFARDVPGIVKKFRGVPVYAGGDDVFAYLPLHTAIECVQELAESFRQKLAAFTIEENGKKISPTLSAGLVIAHHQDPLSEVLDLARRTEKAAKMVPGKNALAITLNKRSGSERQIRGNLSQLVNRLKTIRGWWLNQFLSKGVSYEYMQLAQMENVLPPEALQAEAIRILKRKKASGGKDIPKEVMTTLRTWIMDSRISLQELAQEMIVAAELARAKQLAQGGTP